MTTIEINENDSQVRQWYSKLWNQVAEIDTQLVAASDTTGKRKFTNDLVEEYKPSWENGVNNFLAQLEPLDEKAKAGIYYGFVRAIVSSLKEDVDKWIDAQVPSIPKEDIPQIDPEVRKQLSEQRTALVKQLKMVVEMASNFGEFTEENAWAVPESRRGSFGPRGQRALTSYTWSVDGTAMPNVTTKGVAEAVGYTKAKELMDALREQKIDGVAFDTKNPPDSFEFDIHGHKVSATRNADAEDDDDDDDDAEVSTETEPTE